MKRNRDWLSGRLNREGVPDSMYDVLVCLGYMGELGKHGTAQKDAIQGIKRVLAFGDLTQPVEDDVKRAMTLLAYTDVLDRASSTYDEAKEPKEEIDLPARPRLDDRESERARAIAEYVAYRAATSPHVQRFRMFALGDYLLPREQVWDLQDSPAEWKKIFEASHDSVLPKVLEDAGAALAEQVNYYWSVEEAIAFILADEVSWREPVRVMNSKPDGEPVSYGTVTLEVEPWVSTATVTKLYQYEQMRMLGHKPRALSPRNVQVAHFVFAQLRIMWYALLRREIESRRDTEFTWYEGISRKLSKQEGHYEPPEKPTWRLLMNLWNDTNQAEPYDSERRFRGDFFRAATALVRTFDAGYENTEHGGSS